MNHTIEDMIADGDRVAARWHASGTHVKEAWGRPPTGKPIVYHGITMVRIRDGQITDFWKKDDSHAVWQRIEQQDVDGEASH